MSNPLQRTPASRGMWPPNKCALHQHRSAVDSLVHPGQLVHLLHKANHIWVPGRALGCQACQENCPVADQEARRDLLVHLLLLEAPADLLVPCFCARMSRSQPLCAWGMNMGIAAGGRVSCGPCGASSPGLPLVALAGLHAPPLCACTGRRPSGESCHQAERHASGRVVCACHAGGGCVACVRWTHWHGWKHG